MKKILIVSLLIMFLFPIYINSQVAQEWVATYGGTGTTSYYAIKNATDKFGNLIVAGRTGSDFITLKYDNSGNLLWARTYDGGLNNDDQTRDMVLDDSSNIYVTGYSYEGTTNGGVNWLTIKYNPDGKMIWKKSLDWTGHKGDDPNFIAVDENNNVYVTGYGYVGPPPLLKEDLVLVKYNCSGILQWSQSLSSSSASSSVGYSIIIDHFGNPIVSGYTGNRIAVAKYNDMGKLIWSREYFRNSASLTAKSFSKLDKENNIIVVGYYSVATQDNFATIKYDQNGNLIWSSIFDSPIGASDFSSALTIDTNSNILIAGNTFTFNYYDVLVLKYSPDGDTLLVKTYDGGNNSDDLGTCITNDSINNIYVSGYSKSNITYNDFVTLKYNPAGEFLWAKKFTSPALTYSSDIVNSISLDKYNNVLITGSSQLGPSIYGITSIKYSQLTAFKNNNYFIQKEFRLFQNYPNPFNPLTFIKYEMVTSGYVSIEIFNSRGIKIHSLVNEEKDRGIYEAEFNGSNFSNGIYFYSFYVNGILKSTRKLILLK